MKTKNLFFLTFAIFFSIASFSQEFDCFNQIDDDGDGLTDIADPDCDCYLFNAVGDSFQTNTPPPGNIGQYCFDITQDQLGQRGAIWLLNKIDLSNDFKFSAEIYAGTKDFTGADGFAIVLQDSPNGLNSLGWGGLYLGAGAPDPTVNIVPSIAFEVDTYDNGAGQGDISNDHIAININGDPTTPVGSPTTIDLGNIEDDNYHDLIIEWDATTQVLYFEVDGNSSSYNSDIQNTIFGGQNLVNFGFTGSTGGFYNRQSICITGFELPSAGESSVFQLCNSMPGTFNLFDQLGGSPEQYGSWTDPSGNSFGTSNIGAFDINTDTLGVYTYTVPNGSGCVSPFATVEVRNSSSNFNMEAMNATGCDLTDGSIEFTNLHPSTDYTLNYIVNGTSATSLNFTSSVTGTYTLTNIGSGNYESVVLTNDGCDSEAKAIRVNENCIIPSGISPNKDGINDCFDIEWVQATNIQIFNRYGSKVYERSDYRNEWCGGTEDGLGGDELPTGTYYYVIEVSNSNPITGWVYINRGN